MLDSRKIEIRKKAEELRNKFNINGYGITDLFTGTSGFVSISDSDRRVPAELGQESQASSCKEEWNSACLSSYSRGDRQLVELCLESAGLSRRCTRVSVPLRVVASSTGLPFKRCPGIGFLSRVDRGSGSFSMCYHP